VSDDALKFALRNGVLQWQKKYGVVDGDPILGCLELFEIYFNTIQSRNGSERAPTFEEFRSSLELLDQRSKSFTKQSADLIQELRALPALSRKMRSYHAAAIICVALASLIAGLLIGRFLL
jgi:AAA+ ATPase superfamily predicted ATPase